MKPAAHSLPVHPDLHRVAKGLAAALIHAGEGNLRAHLTEALGRHWPWLTRLPSALRQHFSVPLRAEDYDRVVEWLETYRPFVAAFKSGLPWPRIRRYFSFAPKMAEAPAPLRDLGLPVLDSVADLTRWLQLSEEELDWFADTAGWGCQISAQALQHYHYQWKPKSDGSLRLIESPKERLREIQQRILRELLNRVPMHAAAHGCVRGRSALSGASVHAGAAILIHLDLRDFFSSISAGRVHALFHTLGYSHTVSRYLTGLTTHCSHSSILRNWPQPDYASPAQRRACLLQARKLLARHLPQGAPTSPALANLCAWRLDERLNGAAQACNGQYTRYVDDLALSLPENSLARARRISLMLQTIILEEGFEAHPRKTRIMTQAQPQRLTGLIVNTRPNLPRHEHDQLKAILTNCARHGPTSQNREQRENFRAWLEGRVSYATQINPTRGARLQALLAQIDWSR
jgi:hypothetical protein